MPHNSEQPPADLQQAITELQREVPVREAWRENLHRELARTQPPTRSSHATATKPSRSWRITPLTAAAAAVAFMIVGAMLGDFLRQRGAANNGPGPARLATTSPPDAAMGVRFALMAPGVRRVSLVGDFNGWNADATPLTLSGDGRTWTTMLPLSAGRHTYAFVIDGQIVRDPIAPAEAEEDFGMPNSVVLVSSRE
jgi:hypothetical protein